ncbi:efflux RND transporter permease subunit [bacterium]|nr:efflux RND transporter permease subunit [bacterium]
MKIAEISIKKRVGTILLTMAVIVLGIISIREIPVSFWPEFVAPALIIVTPFPGASPAEVEEMIAEPLEEQLSTIDRVDEIETSCLEGICRTTVRFNYGIDFDEAKLDVQERTNRARSMFPRRASNPTVLQVQDFLPPGIEVGFSSKTRELNELRRFVETKLKNRFLRLEKVANVQVLGGYEQEVLIRVNPDKLHALGLSLSQINTALVSENADVPAGKFTTERKNYFVRVSGEFESIRGIKNIIVSSSGGNPVYLKDVASVEFENKERDSITRVNGKELIIMAFREKSGGNTVAMVDQVRSQLDNVKKLIPSDIQLSIVSDQSIFIENAINNVVRNAALGALLAGIIIFLFLGRIRNFLIIAFSIPISIIGSFFLIDTFGLSINTISLGGLALGIGMIVDSSVVVMENIFRHMQEARSQGRLKTVVDATREVGAAITSSNLTSIVVFLPLAFLVGLFAVLFGELALTVVFALSLSIIVALTVVPMLSYKLIQVEGERKKINVLARGWQSLLDRVLGIYRPTLRWVLRHRLITLFSAVAILGLFVGFLAPRLDTELLPPINEGEITVEFILPEGTRLDYTDEVIQKVETQVGKRKEVEQVKSVGGFNPTSGERKQNIGVLTVSLKPEYFETINSLMTQIRKSTRGIPGVKITVKQVDVSTGMAEEPVNIRIAGDDLSTLDRLGGEAVQLIETVPGVVNLSSTLQQGVSEYVLRIDRTQASDLGISSAQVRRAVRAGLSGVSGTRLSLAGEEYDITVKGNPSDLRSLQQLLDFPVTTRKKEVIPLRSVVSVDLKKSPSEIKRFDQQRGVEIKADVEGRSQREVVSEVKEKMGGLKLPEDYFMTYGGQSESITQSFQTLLTALIIAIFLVYVVMGFQFNSFIHPFTIALSIPLALVGVILGLLIFDAKVSINALTGMIMVVGIVVNNGILLVDYINQLRERGFKKTEAIVEGGAIRLRPILITSMTTIFAMLPIALSLGQGGEALKPLGAVVCGGLLTSTFLTLIIIPCVYSLLDRLSRS